MTPASPSTRRELGPVSVVVCNYNGENYIADCLESILAQDDAGIDEVLVVDNGSEDRSRAIVRERFPSVRLVEVGANRGPCVARNLGMREARNRWVFAVDNDAILRPDVLSRLRRAAEECPEAAAVQPRSVLASDTGRIHYDGARFHYAGVLSLRNFYQLIDEAEGEGTLPVDGAVAIAVLMDREAVFEVGAYDEEFFILFEDYDLSQRLRIAGYTILAVEDAIVLHRGGTPGISFREGMSYPPVRAFYHSRNRWLLLVKNHRLTTLLVSLPGLVLYELAWLAFTILGGHVRAYLEGKVSFFRSLPRALRQRRTVAGFRKVSDGKLLVGGPLTLSPELVQSWPGRTGARILDGCLRGWWWVAKWFVA